MSLSNEYLILSNHLMVDALDDLDQNTPRLPTIEDEDVRQAFDQLFIDQSSTFAFRSLLNR